MPNPKPVLDHPTGAVVICFRLPRLKQCHWFKKCFKIPFSEPIKQLAVTKTRLEGEGEFHARARKQF
jgi:hypothetical protein